MSDLSLRTKASAHAERLKWQLKDLAANTAGVKVEPKMVFNPLLKWPRNNVCVCGSGKKFKKCCLNELSTKVTIKDAKFLKDRMDKYRV